MGGSGLSSQAVREGLSEEGTLEGSRKEARWTSEEGCTRQKGLQGHELGGSPVCLHMTEVSPEERGAQEDKGSRSRPPRMLSG